MKSFSSIQKTFVAGASMLVLSAFNLSAQTVDDVVAKINEAVGGVAKQKAVKTMRTDLELIVQGGALKLPMKAIQKRPALLYTEITYQGMQIKSAYDGKGGWQINPLQGQSKPAAMNEEEIKQNEEQADMDGELIDSKEKGYKVDLMGKEDLDGSMAYKLKVVNKHGDIKYRFFDAETYLPIKTITKTKTKEGGESEAETYFSDFKKFNGLTVPCTVETKMKGQTMSQIVIKNVEFDKPVDDKIFAAPGDLVKKDEKATEKK